MSMVLRGAAAAAVVLGVGLLFTFEYGPVETVQTGFRGVAMEQNYRASAIPASVAANKLPDPIDKVEPGGELASAVYQNVQVLGDLTEVEFLRVMTGITAWVSPEQGCTYCHAEGEELSSDSLYTKVVARKMIQMTRAINVDWNSHVQATGVTCYTCHRGQPVPTGIWFGDQGRGPHQGMLGNQAGQNRPATQVGLTSLPADPFTTFLVGKEDPGIRVIGNTALPTGNRQSTKQAEWTYGLMVHMSESLGVNCTYCHNSRAFADWSQSPPQRTTAWHGIRLVRDVNAEYILPLQGVFPAHRLGPGGDVAKVNCQTCHKGAYKPLFGAPMAADWPELARKGPAAPGQTAALGPLAPKP